MRCCEKSIRWLGSALALGVWAVTGSAQTPADGALAQDAVAQSVRARLGWESEVAIEAFELRTSSELPANVVAVPGPGARLASRARFSLFESADGTETSKGRRVGYAVAVLRVSRPHLRLARSVARGDMLGADDLVETTGDLGPQAILPLPAISDATGARARRSLTSGDVLTHAVLALEPAVRAGDLVRVRSSASGVVATLTAVASQTGQIGHTITFVNRETGRRLKGRITGSGEAEVVYD